MSQLYRSKKDRIIGGVCGGIAEHFKVETIWIRLAAILLVLVDGIGILLYLAAWLLIPEAPGAKVKVEKSMKRGNGSRTIGIIFIILGLFFLFDNIFQISFRYFWPGIIILLGIYFLTKRQK